MRRYRSFLAFTLTCLIAVTNIDLSVASASAAPEYNMIDLGTLGGRSSTPTDINDAGQVVGYADTRSGQSHAFFWNNGTMTDLGTLGGSYSYAAAINSNGQVAGESATLGGAVHAFLWDNGIMTDLGTLGGQNSAATGLNDRGQVVGWSNTIDGEVHVFLWDNGTMTDLGTLGGSESRACCINASGQVAGHSSIIPGSNTTVATLWSNGINTNIGALIPRQTSSDVSAINNIGQVVGTAYLNAIIANHAFFYNGSIATDLGTLGGNDSEATDINAAGQVAGTSRTTNGTFRGFLWSGGLMNDLGVLSNTYNRAQSYACCINDAGQVAGDSDVASNSTHALIWTDGVMTDLGTLGGLYSHAIAMNATGQVTGQSYTASGASNAQHAFLASPVPTAPLTDSDGDGLPDEWEINGVTIDRDGSGPLSAQFTDLPAMGADPNKKDIFVQVDWMEDNNHNQKPDDSSIQKIVEAFNESGVDGKGINLHVDIGPDSKNHVTGDFWGDNGKGHKIEFKEILGQDSSLDKEISNIIQDGQPRQSDAIFHYALFISKFLEPSDQSTCHSGKSLGDKQIFLVSLGCSVTKKGSINEQAGTFMHELGHNLGLCHEGPSMLLDPSQCNNPDYNYKPNYLSVMNYLFQTNGLIINGKDGNFDYSRFELPELNETNLNQHNGLNGLSEINNYGTRHYCGFETLRGYPFGGFKMDNNANGPIDWNCDFLTIRETVQHNVNNAGGDTQTLSSYNDWNYLVYKQGNIGLGTTRPPIMITPEDIAAAPVELTTEQDLSIQRINEPRVRLSASVLPTIVTASGTITYVITMLNTDAGDAEGVSISDMLPPNFTYHLGSTSGATTADPTIDGQVLTWAGPFLVSANNGTLTLTFQVTAADAANIYFSSVSGSSTNGIVIPTGDTAPIEVVQANQPPALTVPGQQNIQYSDLLSFNVSAIDPDNQGAELKFFASGLPNGFNLTDNHDGTATVVGTVQSAAGTYNAQITVTDPGGLTDTKTVALVVVKEDSTIAYNGDTLVQKGTPITLRANVSEVADSSPGDLAKAEVFFDMTAGIDGATTSYGPVPVSANGEATLSLPNGLPANVYNIAVRVVPTNGYYQASPADPVSLVLYDPAAGFTIGGGKVLAGGGRADFGFAVGFVGPKNKKVLVGQALYIFQKGKNVLKLKSNAMQWLMMSGTTATFRGNATVNGTRNYTFEITVVDKGRLGTADTLAIKVWKPDGTLLHQIPTTKLSRGNIIVPH